MKKSPNCQSSFLTRREAADFLNVTVSAMARWASRKRGPDYYKIGREARYCTEDLEAFLSSKRRPG